MVNPKHFRELVVRPTLQYLGMWSVSAEELMMGTAMQESRLKHLAQIGGPALGIYQVEPETHDDILDHWLAYRPDTASRVRALASQHRWESDPHSELVTNLAYATAMARLVYYRRPEPLPDADDVPGLARYWKEHYNTKLGRGTVADWVASYELLMEHERRIPA